MLADIEVGDMVNRMLAGTILHVLRVSEVTRTMIICGPWTFDRKTGAEIDDGLDWGPPPKMTTGSYICQAAEE